MLTPHHYNVVLSPREIPKRLRLDLMGGEIQNSAGSSETVQLSKLHVFWMNTDVLMSQYCYDNKNTRLDFGKSASTNYMELIMAKSPKLIWMTWPRPSSLSWHSTAPCFRFTVKNKNQLGAVLQLPSTPPVIVTRLVIDEACLYKSNSLNYLGHFNWWHSNLLLWILNTWRFT